MKLWTVNRSNSEGGDAVTRVGPHLHKPGHNRHAVRVRNIPGLLGEGLSITIAIVMMGQL